MNKSHLFFNNPTEGIKSYNQRSRAVFAKEEENIEKNYSPMKNDFQIFLNSYYSDKEIRDNNRNGLLEIPYLFDLIEIDFFNHFEIDRYENYYRSNFGLVPIQYNLFNRNGLFAIDDIDLFKNFIDNIKLFISNKNDNSLPNDVDNKIIFIKSFKFYSSVSRKRYNEVKENYIIKLVDKSVDIYERKIKPVEESLIEYLNNNNVVFSIDEVTTVIEVSNISINTLNEIIDNYDIIMTVNSPITGVVKPSPFNLETKDYGFEISNSTAELPIVGIIDTGVSSLSPLDSIIINVGNEFDLTNTNPKIDDANHGTAIAAIAALGKAFYYNNSKFIEADAKILSIKALNGNWGFVSENDIRNAIIEANNKYNIKVFVLCLSYTEPKEYNSSISNYAYSLDLLSNELNILIFISVGNSIVNYFDNSGQLIEYPYLFNNPNFNLNSPADSMNNISCGAISSNLENTTNNSYNLFDPTLPASYTRKFFINRKSIKSSLISKHLTKPDLCDCGGEMDLSTEVEHTGLKVLSADPGIFFERVRGTSYSTPFLANHALQILKL